MTAKILKNATLHTIVDDATLAVAEYAKWPTVPARAEKAERECSYLREALRGFDPTLLRAMILHIVAEFLSSAHNLDVDKEPAALRRGLAKLVDALPGSRIESGTSGTTPTSVGV